MNCLAPSSLQGAFATDQMTYPHDLTDVKGHAHVKGALEVAAADRHKLLLIGPPGNGKTMMARRLPSIFYSPTF